MTNNYENGKHNGRTEATLDGIAKSIDDLWDKIDALPCPKMGERVRALETGQKIVLWVLGAAGTAIMGAIAWVCLRGE